MWLPPDALDWNFRQPQSCVIVLTGVNGAEAQNIWRVPGGWKLLLDISTYVWIYLLLWFECITIVEILWGAIWKPFLLMEESLDLGWKCLVQSNGKLHAKTKMTELSALSMMCPCLVCVHVELLFRLTAILASNFVLSFFKTNNLEVTPKASLRKWEKVVCVFWGGYCSFYFFVQNKQSHAGC